MPIARYIEVVIVIALFSPLAIIAWKYPKQYRVGALVFIGLSTLALFGYESYHQGAEKMYRRAWEASNYHQRTAPWDIRPVSFLPDTGAIRINAQIISSSDTSAPARQLDSTMRAYQKTIYWWVDVLPGKLESDYIHVDPLWETPVFFGYMLLTVMLWGLTYLCRLKRPRTV